jgi:hypothetical protein
MACVKHFALNSMENARQTVDVTADQRTLHEVYLAHFKRVVDAGVAAVMSAYNSVNGAWAGQNRALLTDILKKEWGFTGFVITDFITGMRDAKKAALAGQDIEMPFSLLYHRDLAGLIERGEVPAARIDDAALRILREEVRFGQGRDPSAYTADVVGSPAHRRLAREVAEKSIVLLKNEGDLLPLARAKRLTVIGRLAAVANTGDGGSSNTRPAYVVTPLDGLRSALGDACEVVHDDGADHGAAAKAATGADAVLVVVGYTHADEGEYIPPDQLSPFAASFPAPPAEEAAFAHRVLAGGGSEGFSPGGDRLRLTLNPADEALIKAVADANPRTIVAVMAILAELVERETEGVDAADRFGGQRAEGSLLAEGGDLVAIGAERCVEIFEWRRPAARCECRRQAAQPSAARGCETIERRLQPGADRVGEGGDGGPSQHDQVVANALRGAHHRVGIGVVGETARPFALRLLGDRLELRKGSPRSDLQPADFSGVDRSRETVEGEDEKIGEEAQEAAGGRREQVVGTRR